MPPPPASRDEDHDSIPINLRHIRLACGLTQTALAQAAGLSRVAYRNLETGASIPRDATLNRLAAALHVTPQALLRRRSTLDRVRLRSRTTLRSRGDLIAFAASWISNYDLLESLVHAVKTFPLNPMNYRLGQLPPGPTRLEQAASSARYALRVHPYHPIPDLCAALENSGIKVLLLSVASPTFAGFSVSYAIGGPAIAINAWPRIPVEHQLFTAARELGHLLLHPASYDVTRTAPAPAEAREATQFADHLLMPTFATEWAKAAGLPLLDRALKLKHIFRVPLSAILRRAFPQDRSPHRRLSLPATAEPNRLPPHAFLPTRLSRLVRKALSTTPLPPSQAAQLLGLTPAEMTALQASWPDQGTAP